MGKVIIAAMVAVVGFAGNVYGDEPKQAGIGTFSEGYRIGQITKFSVKGLFF